MLTFTAWGDWENSDATEKVLNVLFGEREREEMIKFGSMHIWVYHDGKKSKLNF